MLAFKHERQKKLIVEFFLLFAFDFSMSDDASRPDAGARRVGARRLTRRVRHGTNAVRRDTRQPNVRVSGLFSVARVSLETNFLRRSRSHQIQSPRPPHRLLRSVCDRVLPASHVTFASEKREWALPEGSCDVDVGLDLSLVQNRSTNTVDALAVRLAFDRYGDKNKATRPNRLPPGRTVLALGDLNLFEWNEDGCDSEVCGRLVGEHTAGGSDGLSFARFESVVQILDSWRRVAGEKKAGGKTPKTRAGVGAPALVPPELFTNATLMKLFRGRSGQVAVVGDDSRTGGDDYRDNDNDSYLMSISQWLFLLRDANVLDGAFSPAGACVIFARARSGGGNDTTGTAQLADLSLRFVPDFVCAVALVASAKGWSVEDVLGRMVCTAAPASEQIGNLRKVRGFPNSKSHLPVFPYSYQKGRLTSDCVRNTHHDRLTLCFIYRKCFALLDATRSGFISTRDLPKALCAGGWLAHLSLEDGFCFLRNRVDGLSADKGYVAPIDEFPGVVSLAECELHAFAASRVPKSSGNRLEPTDRETIAVSDVLSSEVANVFHRVCCAGVEAGFTTQPHPKLMDETRFLTCLKRYSRTGVSPNPASLFCRLSARNYSRNAVRKTDTFCLQKKRSGLTLCELYHRRRSRGVRHRGGRATSA